MGVLVMLELDGDTAELLAAAAELDRLLPSSPGMLARIVAPLETGMVLFQLWESAEARQANADDPDHTRAFEESGMKAALEGLRPQVFEGASLLRPLPPA